MNYSSILLHGLKNKHALNDYGAYTPPMHEGYALFIEEGRPDTSLDPSLILTLVWIMHTVIRALYDRNLELVHNAITGDMGFWTIIHFFQWRFRHKDPFLIPVVRLLIFWYYYYNEDMRMDRNGWIFVLVIVISSRYYPTVLWLFAKYPIGIIWKEGRSFFLIKSE